jgi:hypothetical protein
MKSSGYITIYSFKTLKSPYILETSIDLFTISNLSRTQ